MSMILTFNPNRQAISTAGRDFILDLNLAKDGTGIARLSEIFPDESVRLITCSFRQNLQHDWSFSTDWRTGSGSTPAAAARELIKTMIGINSAPSTPDPSRPRQRVVFLGKSK